MKKTFETFCPCFPGFYESFLYSADDDCRAADDCIDFFGSQHEMQPGLIEEIMKRPGFEFDVDFSGYTEMAARKFCEVTAEKLNDIFYFNPVLDVDDPGFEIEFEKVVSPKYYNFETDSVNCKITFDIELVLNYCRKNIENFAKYLKERYKTRSGFISYYDYDVETWLNVDNWSNHHPGAILEFILLNEDEEAECHLSEKVIDDVPYREFVEMPQIMYELFDSEKGKEIAEKFNNGEQNVETAADLMIALSNNQQ